MTTSSKPLHRLTHALYGEHRDPTDNEVYAALNDLTYRERLVLSLRFGIIGGETRTLAKVSESFDVTRERIRQIESKALRKLRHPSRLGGAPIMSQCNGAGLPKPYPRCAVCLEVMPASKSSQPHHRKCLLGTPCTICGTPVRGHTPTMVKSRRAKYPGKYPGTMAVKHKTCIEEPIFWPCSLCGRGVRLDDWQRYYMRLGKCSDVICGRESCQAQFKKDVLPLMAAVGRSRYNEQEGE